MNLLDLPNGMLCRIYRKCDHLTSLRCMRMNKKIEGIVRKVDGHKIKIKYLSIKSIPGVPVSIEFQYTNSDQYDRRRYTISQGSDKYIQQVLSFTKEAEFLTLTNMNITDKLLTTLIKQKCIQKHAELNFDSCRFKRNEEALFDRFIQMIEPSVLNFKGCEKYPPYKLSIESLLSVARLVNYDFYDQFYSTKRALILDLSYLDDTFLELYFSKNRSFNLCKCETNFTLVKILDLCKAKSLLHSSVVIRCIFGILNNHSYEEIVNTLTINGVTYRGSNYDGFETFAVTLQEEPLHLIVFECRHVIQPEIII